MTINRAGEKLGRGVAENFRVTQGVRSAFQTQKTRAVESN